MQKGTHTARPSRWPYCYCSARPFLYCKEEKLLTILQPIFSVVYAKRGQGPRSAGRPAIVWARGEKHFVYLRGLPESARRAWTIGDGCMQAPCTHVKSSSAIHLPGALIEIHGNLQFTREDLFTSPKTLHPGGAAGCCLSNSSSFAEKYMRFNGSLHLYDIKLTFIWHYFSLRERLIVCQ